MIWLLVCMLGLVAEAVVIIALGRGVTGAYEPPTADHEPFPQPHVPPGTTSAGTAP